MFDWLYSDNENPVMRAAAELDPQQVYNLARGIGCVQCGRDSTEVRHGHKCCGRQPCRTSIRIIHDSHVLAKRLRSRPA